MSAVCLSNTSRWISRDPIGEKGGINLYDYVRNRPTSLLDPLGLLDLDLFPARTPAQQNYAGHDIASDEYYQVGAHGDPSSRYLYDQNGNQLTPQTLANMMYANGYYPGMPVELDSCFAGKGDNSFAQQLANILGTLVIAPNNMLWPYQDGSYIVAPANHIDSDVFPSGPNVIQLLIYAGPDYNNPGRMVPFSSK